MSRGATWRAFAYWSMVGGSLALSLLAVLSVGAFLLPLVLVAAVVLARRPGSGPGLPGMFAGASVPLLYLAFLNRKGPGEVCTTTHVSVSCDELGSPWPWVIVACVALALGLFLQVRRSADPRR